MTCKDCIHSGVCYKENDYDNFPDNCGEFVPERPTGKWIPVKERLPDVAQRYLVYTKYDEIMTDFFMGDEFIQGNDIIAWMPLPEAYKKVGEGE